MSEHEEETVEPTEPVEPTPEEQEEGEQIEPTEPEEGELTGPQSIPGQPDVEPEGEPEPQGFSEKELEKIGKALDKLRETTANRVGAILGEEAPLLMPCPVCGDGIPGHVYPPDIAPPQDGTVKAVKAYIGQPTEDQFKPHPDFEKCEECDGMSEVLTGSLRPGYWTTTCPGCNGLGYKEKATLRSLSGSNWAQEPTPILTGPTAPPQVEPPEAASLKAKGWLVVPPAPGVAAAE